MQESGDVMTQSNEAQGGYALLEALMAILVFSLGLLGIIGFQASAIKISSESQMRTEASLLADELIAGMSVSNFSSVATDYAAGGTKFLAWYNNRLKGASKLPNPTASVEVAPGTTPTTLQVRVCIDWEAPGQRDTVGVAVASACTRDDPTKPWKFQTQAMLF